MKISKAQASSNRDAIVHAAASQLRARGFDRMSVADVARTAGLTHGALYSHFKSKEILNAEAARVAFEDCAREFSGLPPHEFFERYLSPEHRDNSAEGCPTSALVSEMRRQPQLSRDVFHAGVEQFIRLASESLKSVGAEHSHDRAVLVFAAMVGGLALSRAVYNVDGTGSDDILRAVRSQLELLIAEPASEDRPSG